MSQTLPTPPIAKRVPFVREHLGHTIVDDYAWLQDPSDPEVIAYLEAENAYARSAMQHTLPLQQQLYDDMRARVAEVDASAPQQHGDYDYYVRYEAGKQYRLFCRKRRTPDAPEELLLDENVLAEGLAYCSVEFFEISPDQNLLAYGVDITGARVTELYVKDLRTGETLVGPIPNVDMEAAWANDNRSLFYATFDNTHRADKLWRLSLGGPPSSDTLVYHETDEAYEISVRRSCSGAYILLNIRSHIGFEVRFVSADTPQDEFRVVEPRTRWLEYDVEHHGDQFIIRTNADGAENFKLVTASPSQPGREHWRELLPHRPDTLIESHYLFKDYLVLFERSGGLQQIRISAPDAVSNAYHIAFPESVYGIEPDDGQPGAPFYSSVLRFRYSSLATPVTTVDYDMANRTWTVAKQQQIPCGHDPSRYILERLYATAPDGTRVPMSVIYRADLRNPNGNPTLLEAYGSYGASSDPVYYNEVYALLDRGFVYAIGHIRGGSELGRSWYEQGRLLNKKNTFTDFIACAELLVEQGYTTPKQLGIIGLSAGGLLMSAVANMRPDLFGAIVAKVPYTNVISAMLMPELPLTVIEYAQWGNPYDQTEFDYMCSYSPYDLIEAKEYPPILATGGLNDLQVPYWDPAKWVARLRATKTDQNPVYLLTNMEAGHSGYVGRFDHLREQAEIYAFLIDSLTKTA